jgi:hypothetical protein
MKRGIAPSRDEASDPDSGTGKGIGVGNTNLPHLSPLFFPRQFSLEPQKSGVAWAVITPYRKVGSQADRQARRMPFLEQKKRCKSRCHRRWKPERTGIRDQRSAHDLSGGGEDTFDRRSSHLRKVNAPIEEFSISIRVLRLWNTHTIS